MCELCSEGWSEEEPNRIEGATCAFQAEDSPSVCGAPAMWRLRERYVEGHMCEQHAREAAEALGSGFMEMLQEAGISEGETLRPISGEAACDECSRPATYANLTMAT